ncbi:hypothetical protein JOD43_003190 [Pullulanibacillus pueri]|uniref:DUF2292 domain-containing protein n=1 Tax=Pullulanibacillus pueri TaxID=1437324 RepID=A0A8J3EN97_9BACL|nr:DUF2292 domain-containing protein [Pullulanibacillus pueri]MBM7683011.1 hypothetical protein [Pullulanibacillus pueri]GGH85877.1 hypothetical protein GCM10007096_32280 [Pullulanibacillus pueri]
MAKVTKEKLNSIIHAMEVLDFGSILVTIHEGEITQLDVTEKNRFPQNKKKKEDRQNKSIR